MHALTEIKITNTDEHVCEDCIKVGDSWLRLRTCLSCGHVGCFDSSKNKHARKHFHRIGYPLIRSIEPGERWIWCYVDSFAPRELNYRSKDALTNSPAPVHVSVLQVKNHDGRE